MSFLQPVYVGDLVTVHASVNDVGTTSMEVGVHVEAEDLNTGKTRHVSSAYLVFVALDEQGRPRPAPKLIPDTEEASRRAAAAKLRRQHRLAGEEAIRSLSESEPRKPKPALQIPLPRRPAAIAHRGASGERPENTMAAFERALELAAEFIELDVHLSRDGVPVVIHDDLLERTTDGQGAVRDKTIAELKKLDAGRWFAPTFAGQTVPTLREVLESFAGRTRFLIEIKNDPYYYDNIEDKVVDEVLQASVIDSAVVVSFDHRAVRRVRRLNADLATGILFAARPIDVAQLARAADADLLMPHWAFVREEDVRLTHEAGLVVFAWTTDQPEVIQSLTNAGVDGIVSNWPARALDLRRPA